MLIAPVLQQQKSRNHMFTVAILLWLEYELNDPNISTWVAKNNGAIAFFDWSH